MKCKFCDGELNDEDKICPQCGKPVERIKICPHCNEEQSQESVFCNKCGWNFETNSMPHKYCPKCGNDLEDDAKFCNKCGYDFTNKPKDRKKKPILPIIIIAVIIAGCVAGGTVFYMHQKAVKEAYEAEQEALREAERQRQERIVSYQKKAIDVRDAIQEAKANFNITSIMFSTSTDMNTDLLGPSFYTSYVEGLCSAEITEEKTRKRGIDKLYEELAAIECDEEEVQELKKGIEDFYYAYCERYDLLIEMNFTTSNFDSKESTSVSDFSSKEKAVNEIISQIEFDEDKSDSPEDTEGEKIL